MEKHLDKNITDIERSEPTWIDIEALRNEMESKIKENPIKSEIRTFTADFSDMRISDIGFGRSEYKTSKPNIIRNDAVIHEIMNMSDAAETAIGHTIGPYADATLIQTYADMEVPVYNTRDGYTILQNIKFTQPIPNAIFRIIRETSEFLQEKIGDSTSSGIPIQNALLKKIVEVFNNETKGEWRYSPVGIRNIMSFCAHSIIKGINDNPAYQKSFNELDKLPKEEKEKEIIKWLTKVATISANNDYETGEKIANLYKNKLDGRGNVIVLKSKTEEEYYEESDAFILSTGLFDVSRMANSSDRFTCEFDNPLIAVFDGNLLESDLPGFKKIVQSAAFDFKRPIFVMASMYNYEIAQYMQECINGTYYNELGQAINDPTSDPSAKPVKIEIAGCIVRNKEIADQMEFEDLRLMTNATAFSTEIGKLAEYSDDRETRKQQLEHFFGTCEKLSSSFAETHFIGCTPDKDAFDALIKDLNDKASKLKKLKFHNTDYTHQDLYYRIDRLQARTTYYYCGGRTDKAKYSRKLIIEDATSAVASAIRNYGISIGGNMAICHYIHHNIVMLIDEIVDNINNTRINITAAENFESLREIVSIILESIEFAFGNSYRYALYNMYRDSRKTMDKWQECLNCTTPTIYNIMTNKNEVFNGDNVDECTTIIVPKLTDQFLLGVIVETVGELINVGNMISLMSPSMDLEKLQYEQLASGAAYAASANFGR